MSEEKKGNNNLESFKYQPLEKGYKPTQGNLDNANPPQGGSGMPSTPSSDSGGEDKK